MGNGSLCYQASPDADCAKKFNATSFNVAIGYAVIRADLIGRHPPPGLSVNHPVLAFSDVNAIACYILNQATVYADIMAILTDPQSGTARVLYGALPEDNITG